MKKTLNNIIDENTQPIAMLGRGGVNLLKLFATAFFAVFLTTANTYFVSRVAWIGIGVCCFGISYLWTLNVRRISASSNIERIVYSTGAMLGGLLGVYVSKFFIKH
jgi:hypothetical protein